MRKKLSQADPADALVNAAHISHVQRCGGDGNYGHIDLCCCSYQRAAGKEKIIKSDGASHRFLLFDLRNVKRGRLINEIV